jgi:DNA (cytosine-5)-methyltransferase 1
LEETQHDLEETRHELAQVRKELGATIVELKVALKALPSCKKAPSAINAEGEAPHRSSDSDSALGVNDMSVEDESEAEYEVDNASEPEDERGFDSSDVELDNATIAETKSVMDNPDDDVEEVVDLDSDAHQDEGVSAGVNLQPGAFCPSPPKNMDISEDHGELCAHDNADVGTAVIDTSMNSDVDESTITRRHVIGRAASVGVLGGVGQTTPLQPVNGGGGNGGGVDNGAAGAGDDDHGGADGGDCGHGGGGRLGRVRTARVVYNAAAEPVRHSEPAPQRKLPRQRTTCEKMLCFVCNLVDSARKIQCRGCTSTIHMTCWPWSCKKPFVCTDDWYCVACRGGENVTSPGIGLDAPCLLCGIRDDCGVILRCDNCDGLHHELGLDDEAKRRYEVANKNANIEEWYCNKCEPRREANINGKHLPNLFSYPVSFIPAVIEKPNDAEPDDDEEDHHAGRAHDWSEDAMNPESPNGTAPGLLRDPLIADHMRAPLEHPTLESFLSDGRMITCLRIPELLDSLYEVIKLVYTRLIDGVVAVEQSEIYVYTGRVIDLLSLTKALNDHTPNRRVFVGYRDGWRIPKGYQAIVPAQFDKATMTMKQLPSRLSRDAHVVMEKHQGDTFNMCDAFCGAGGFIDGIRRAGILKHAYGFDFDAEVVNFARQYLPDANIEMFVADIASLVGTAYTLRGSDAELLLEKLSKGQFDILTGGSPCIGFTQINQCRDGTNAAKKRNLTMLWGMLVVRVSPRYAILENVPELATPEFSDHLGALLLLLWSNGYQTRMYIVKSNAVNSASNRKRFFMVVSKIGTPLPTPPRPTHKCDGVGVAWALVPGQPSVWSDAQLDIFRLKPQATVGKVLNAIRDVTEHVARPAGARGRLHAARVNSQWVTAILKELPFHVRQREGLKIFDTCAFEDIPVKIIKRIGRSPGFKERFIRRKFQNKAESNKWLGIRRSVCKRLDLHNAAPSFTGQFDPFGFMSNNVHPTEPRVVTPLEALMFAAFDKKRLLQVENIKLSTGYLAAANSVCPLVVTAVGLTLNASYDDREAVDFGVR